MSSANLCVIGLLESVVRYAALVCYSKFGGCALFGSSKCIVFTGIAVATSHSGPLYGGGPLLRGAVIGGSTVDLFTNSCGIICAIVFCPCSLVFGNATVVVVSHPEEAIFVTSNSHATVELVRECVNQVVVWTVDPETAITTTLTDGNVALSINGNTCRRAKCSTTIASDRSPLWREDLDAVGATGNNMEMSLMIKSQSPGTVLTGEGVGNAVIFIEHLDMMVALVSYVNFSFRINTNTSRKEGLSLPLSTAAKFRNERSFANTELLDSVIASVSDIH